MNTLKPEAKTFLKVLVFLAISLTLLFIGIVAWDFGPKSKSHLTVSLLLLLSGGALLYTIKQAIIPHSPPSTLPSSNKL